MARRRVTLVTLGCARNDADSADLERQLTEHGWEVVEAGDGGDDSDGGAPDLVVVNTCGFIEQAKRDSLEVVLGAADGSAPVVVTGCLAERYGAELDRELPEVAAVLGFDAYPDIADHLDDVLRGHRPEVHEPRDRRRLLPIAPIERTTAAATPSPIPRPVPRPVRGPIVPVKLATGCDRRCSFCAIPTFRGSFVSRPLDDVVAEVAEIAAAGAAEICLVSENTTSYGKDLGDLRLLERSLARIAEAAGGARIRLTYLQPAEMRPALVRAIAGTAGVASYFDLSLQHASRTVLRRMRRFGGADDFLELIGSIRAADPRAGIRSNVIVGFPGETDEDVAVLADFLAEARLDAIGVFPFSPEEGTEAADLADQIDPAAVAERTRVIRDLVDDLVLRRAEERVGEPVDVIIESGGSTDVDGSVRGRGEGRAAHQGPEDAATIVRAAAGRSRGTSSGAAALRPGDRVAAVVVDVDGPDLVAEIG